MSSRHQAPESRTKHNQGGLAHARRRSSRRSGSRKQRTWFLLLVLLGLITLLTLARERGASQGQGSVTPPPSVPVRLSVRVFQAYPFPRPENEVMRPAIDHQGRLWFGAMGQNALVVFDPRTQAFRYLTPPHGHHGIMGVQVAPDDTVWFAEQSANYLGHYFPATGRYQLYPLPWLSIPDPAHPGQVRRLSSAPNELALDAQGEVWFTEFNADRLGRLDPHTGRMQHYALSAKASVQTLYPYGVTIDAEGMVWFTESGTNQLGRLDPATGAMRLFAAPDPHALLMEIASDAQGSIWVTSFTPGLLFRLHPGTGTLTSYLAPAQGSERSALYGLLVTGAGEVWVTMLDRTELATPEKAPVVCSKHTRSCMRGIFRGPDEPQQRIRTSGEAHAYHQALARFATQGKANEGQDIRESHRTPGIRSNHRREPFRENAAPTLWVGAKEAADMEFQMHCAAHPGQISDLTHIARVDAFRTRMTERTLCFERGRRDNGRDRRDCGSSVGCEPEGITAGPDGNLWFTEFNGNQIGRISTK